MSDRVLISKRGKERLGEEPGSGARNRQDAWAMAQQHISVVALVPVDGGWLAFDDITDYIRWNNVAQQKFLQERIFRSEGK